MFKTKDHSCAGITILIEVRMPILIKVKGYTRVRNGKVEKVNPVGSPLIILVKVSVKKFWKLAYMLNLLYICSGILSVRGYEREEENDCRKD